MCKDRAQPLSRIRFRSADDTDAHRMITGLLAEQYWMVAAERRVRSEVIQNRRICHGSRTRMLFYLYPHKRMTASEQTYSENFELCLWRGGVIEIFLKTQSENRHHAGAACGLTLLTSHAWSWRVSLCHANPALSDVFSHCVIPPPGIPTKWACCVITSSWGSSKQAGAMRTYVAQYIVRNFCWSLWVWVLRTQAPGFHLERCAAGLQRTGCQLHIWTALLLSSAACSDCTLPELVFLRRTVWDRQGCCRIRVGVIICLGLDVVGDPLEQDWLTTCGKRLYSYGFCVAKSRIFKGNTRVTLQSSLHIGYFVVR